jgi:ISXO2-like transposase domain
MSSANFRENYWSLLKRGIIGSFHQVSVKHLPRYLNEFSYRCNNRQDAVFGCTLKHLATTENLPYPNLTGKQPKALF